MSWRFIAKPRSVRAFALPPSLRGRISLEAHNARAVTHFFFCATGFKCSQVSR